MIHFEFAHNGPRTRTIGFNPKFREHDAILITLRDLPAVYGPKHAQQSHDRLKFLPVLVLLSLVSSDAEVRQLLPAGVTWSVDTEVPAVLRIRERSNVKKFHL